MKKAFLLGIVPQNSKANWDCSGSMLTYDPYGFETSEPKVPVIGLYEGGARGNGGATDAATWLMRNSQAWRPGWFERLLHEANAGWFVPVLHRLAAGENVPIEEIKKLYSDHNNGKPILEGTGDEFVAKVREIQDQSR
jgi:hypothetical protein